MLYRILSAVFALLTFLFAFIMVSNGKQIYWSTSTIALVAGTVFSGILASAFWKWASDMLEAVRN